MAGEAGTTKTQGTGEGAADPAVTQAAAGATDAAGTDAAKTQEAAGTVLDAGTDEPKKDGAAAAGTKTSEAVADVEVKFPDAFKVDTELVSQFKSVAKEMGLKSEGAQKFADFYVKAETARAQKLASDSKALHEQWKAAAEKDAEYGGAKFKESITTANLALKKFASPALRDLLVQTRLASHPEVVRLFVKLAQADAEPRSIPAGNGAGASNTDEARLRAMYPSMFKQG